MNNIVTTQSMTDLEIKSLLATFLSGRKKTTIEAYRRDLKQFAEFIGESSNELAFRKFLLLPLGQANLLATQYKSYLTEKLMLQAATVNRRLSALRSLVQFARVLGFISWELEIENLQSQPYRDVAGIGVDGIIKMFKVLDSRNDTKSFRDHAILRLLFDLGLRREEVCQIQIEDINLETATVLILGKGRNEKEKLTLAGPTVESIKRWILHRGAESGFLFHRLDKGGIHLKTRLTGVGLYSIIKEIGRKAGIENLSVHKIRHTSITACCEAIAENNLGIETVLKFSRHSSLNTALVYFDHLENQQGKLANLVSGKVK